jgi:brefeldin A-inhibited guanine nucleotide-exchange protein
MMNHHEHLPEVERAGKSLSVDDLFIKDAFLVFRALCKLTMKPLNTERSIPNCHLFRNVA